jgi:anti-sigma factor RsiW
MSRCDDIRAGLDDWLDGPADAGLRREINAHLGECADCASFFEQHRRLAADLGALAGAAERMAEAAPRPARSGRQPWRLRWYAAAVVLLGVAIGVYRAAPWREDQPLRLAEVSPGVGTGDRPEASSGFQVTFPDHRLAVVLESANPRVHIVWLYDETLPPDDSTGAGNSSAPPS